MRGVQICALPRVHRYVSIGDFVTLYHLRYGNRQSLWRRELADVIEEVRDFLPFHDFHAPFDNVPAMLKQPGYIPWKAVGVE